MIRLLHIVAIGSLIASASYAYTIKYETLYQTGELTKLKTRVHKEREAIAVLQAEWQHLNRPDRLQVLADRHTDLQPMKVDQLARFQDIPNRGPRGDGIAQKLEALGLGRDDAPVGSLPRAEQSQTPRPTPRSVTVAPRPAGAATRPAQPGQAAQTPRVTPRPQAAGPNRNAQLLRPPAQIPRPGAPLSLNQSPRPPQR